jgi:hypothetical protein
MNTHQSMRARLNHTCVGGETHPSKQECSLKKMVGRSPGAPFGYPLSWMSTPTTLSIWFFCDGIGAEVMSNQHCHKSLMNLPFMTVALVDSWSTASKQGDPICSGIPLLKGHLLLTLSLPTCYLCRGDWQ